MVMMTSPALSALLAAIHDRRATLPEPIVSLADLVALELYAPGPHDLRPSVDAENRPARNPDDDHPLEWGLR